RSGSLRNKNNGAWSLVSHDCSRPLIKEMDVANVGFYTLRVVLASPPLLRDPHAKTFGWITPDGEGQSQSSNNIMERILDA
ncbi:hypothetical protein SK128_018982, partial [Halocaridina rubra]